MNKCKITCLILCFCILFSLAGCSVSEDDLKEYYQKGEDILSQIKDSFTPINRVDLVRVAFFSNGYYYVEPVTGVMYLWVTGGYKGGLSVMFDVDGLPLTYEKFLVLYESMVTENG